MKQLYIILLIFNINFYFSTNKHKYQKNNKLKKLKKRKFKNSILYIIKENIRKSNILPLFKYSINKGIGINFMNNLFLTNNILAKTQNNYYKTDSIFNNIVLTATEPTLENQEKFNNYLNNIKFIQQKNTPNDNNITYIEINKTKTFLNYAIENSSKQINNNIINNYYEINGESGLEMKLFLSKNNTLIGQLNLKLSWNNNNFFYNNYMLIINNRWLFEFKFYSMKLYLGLGFELILLSFKLFSDWIVSFGNKSYFNYYKGLSDQNLFDMTEFLILNLLFGFKYKNFKILTSYNFYYSIEEIQRLFYNNILGLNKGSTRKYLNKNYSPRSMNLIINHSE